VALDEPLAFSREVLSHSAGAGALSRILAHNFETYLPYDLLVKADRSTMIHSLELRSPFLDTALVECVARLPSSMVRRGTQTKWILKRAFRDVIPEEIQRRGKMGFGMPLATWFRGDLRGYLLDHFHDRARIFDYLQREFVKSVLRDHFEGRADNSFRIWLLLTIQLWLAARAR
jgi:asparagine synthase (glutamine-hydrolysing)